MVEELIKALQAVEKVPNINLVGNEFILRDNEIVLKAADIAQTLLITPTGRCDWDAIDQLRQRGYDVFPVEKDRFGWLIGGIQTSVGILTYG